MMCMSGSNPNYTKENLEYRGGPPLSGSSLAIRKKFRAMHPSLLKSELETWKDEDKRKAAMEKHQAEGGAIPGTFGYTARMKTAEDERKRRQKAGLWDAAHSRRGIVTGGQSGDYKFSSSGHSSLSPSMEESPRRKRLSMLIGGA